MDELRRGNLYHKVYEGVVLQGQKKTADSIDAWVNEQFINNLTKEDVQRGGECDEDRIRLKAMRGFLYKEGVQKLREGFFDLVGAEDTAKAIERWVAQELIRRMKVK